MYAHYKRRVKKKVFQFLRDDKNNLNNDKYVDAYDYGNVRVYSFFEQGLQSEVPSTH